MLPPPQSTVGTVVKTGEDEDPVAVMTVLNTQRYKQLECMQQIRAFLEARLPEGELRQQLSKVGGGCWAGHGELGGRRRRVLQASAVGNTPC